MSEYNYQESEENNNTHEYKKTYSSHSYSYTSNQGTESFSSTHESYGDNQSSNIYGGLASGDNDDEDEKLYLHVDPTANQEKTSDVEVSNCEGKKRALLIGINYIGTKSQLNGCINDVQNIKEFLSSYNFEEKDMVTLTDDQEESKFKPTRNNIIAAMEWLVHDAEPNDSFFFHYSGHGGRVADMHSDEDDGHDETIYPLDYEQYEGDSGQIRDDDLHAILVRPLPKGCRLTAIFDSCHSGTVLDLPYVYSTKGQIKENNMFKHAGMGIFSAGIQYARGDKDGALSSILSLGKQLLETRQISDDVRQRNTTLADVIMFSGCKDDQTSADAQEAGRATGAMSFALTTTLRRNPDQSYHQLLNNLRIILRDKYSQRPQMSASHPIDVNLVFKC
ncbi:caspase domain-containing protein [Sporodiniella umbellata]|nr:caspase domain-containing protein [Sporodiniella umbellata]